MLSFATQSFFSASNLDKASRVTMHTPEALGTVKQSDLFIVKFKYEGADYSILFYCNRKNGESLKTTSWPHGLPELKPGVRFTAEDVEIQKI